MAIYYVWSAAAGSANGSSWTNAFTNLTTAFATEVAGDTLYVAHDHAESTAASVTLTSSGTLANPSKIICVDRAGTVPPVSADRRTTAQVSTTGASHITFAGSAHFDGIIFRAGDAANSADIRLTAATAYLRLDNCSVRCNGTGVSSSIDIGSSNGCCVEFNNTTASFAAVGQSFSGTGMLKWRNTPSALLNTIPTVLFIPAGVANNFECIGVDFSAAGSGKTLAGSANTATAAFCKFKFVDCKLNASVTKSQVPLSPAGLETDFIRSGASGNYTVHSHRYAGLLVEELTIIRSGGASDGVTPLSWRIDTTANCNYSMPFECPVIAIWNDTTGSAVTATVEGIAATLPTDAEVWLDVEYLGDASSSPMGSFVNDGKANLIVAAANQTSSSETWGGSTAAFKLACTFTPQMAGWIYARVKIGKASATVYIDPLVTLS